MAGAVTIRGLRELQRDFGRMSKTLKNGLRDELKQVAEPVRAGAESKAVMEISHIGPQWSRMRLGVTSSSVYVAPASRRRGGSPRGNLAILLYEKAMQPSLDENEPEIVRGLEGMLDRLADSNGF